MVATVKVTDHIAFSSLEMICQCVTGIVWLFATDGLSRDLD